ncbi:hypothetical protein DIPPA_63362 [Diplonema papillatum]|nr:hypothetical protein DIPPA_63362 [Diplonema papillatum]
MPQTSSNDAELEAARGIVQNFVKQKLRVAALERQLVDSNHENQGLVNLVEDRTFLSSREKERLTAEINSLRDRIRQLESVAPSYSYPSVSAEYRAPKINTVRANRRQVAIESSGSIQANTNWKYPHTSPHPKDQVFADQPAVMSLVTGTNYVRNAEPVISVPALKTTPIARAPAIAPRTQRLLDLDSADNRRHLSNQLHRTEDENVTLRRRIAELDAQLKQAASSSLEDEKIRVEHELNDTKRIMEKLRQDAESSRALNQALNHELDSLKQQAQSGKWNEEAMRVHYEELLRSVRAQFDQHAFGMKMRANEVFGNLSMERHVNGVMASPPSRRVSFSEQFNSPACSPLLQHPSSPVGSRKMSAASVLDGSPRFDEVADSIMFQMNADLKAAQRELAAVKSEQADARRSQLSTLPSPRLQASIASGQHGSPHTSPVLAPSQPSVTFFDDPSRAKILPSGRSIIRRTYL